MKHSFLSGFTFGAFTQEVWTILFLFLCLPTYAQTDVTATIRVIPPYSTHLSDYADQPEKTLITLRNNTQRTLQVQLLGVITGENGIELRTAPQFKSPQAIELAPLAVVNLNADAIRNLFDVNKLVLSGVSREALVRGNGLPEGIYTVCIRALDYQTNETLSSEEPMGCSNPMNITNLEPPFLIKPVCGEDTIRGFMPQNLLFTWSFPAGAPPSTEYTLTIVEMLDPRKNPNDAFLSATAPAFFEESVMGNAYLFGPAQPTFISGRRYAYAITARDPFNKVVFRNEGRSEVCAFVYAAPVTAISGNLPGATSFTPTGELDCACQADAPSGSVNNANVTVGTKVKVGQFEMTVLRVTANGNKLNGEGKIPLPLLNSKLIPVLVQFTDLQVNAANQMRAGTVKGKLKSDVDFLPSVPGPNLNTVPLTSSDADKLGDYFERNVAQLVSNIQSSAENAGFELPLGIDKSIGGIGTVIAITGLTFTARQAGFDAATVVDLPEAGMKAAFGARNICLDQASLRGQGTLYLANDLNIASTGLRLKAAAPSFSSPADSGSYVVFDKEGFKRMRVRADYDLPRDLFNNKLKSGQAVVASLLADAVSWSDWLAGVTFDPFYMANNTDFSFSLKPGTFALYDHSSTRNPPGMPIIAEKPNIATPDWNGFFMPEMIVDLPPVIRNMNSDAPITASATNFIIDRMGLTGILNANNILDIGNGNLDGWYYSLDNINVKFVNNSFVSGGLAGKVLLPVSGPNASDGKSQLDYTSTLSRPNGELKFEFVIQPKEDVAAPLWIARLNILNTSNIHVKAGGGGTLEAVATLNGSIDINAKIGPLPQISFTAMKFEELVLQSKAPYVKVKTFVAGLTSPQKSVGVFPVTLKTPELVLKPGFVGLRFAMDIVLADLPGTPNAFFSFDLLGKIRFVGSRPDWGWESPQVNVTEINVAGPVGPVTVKGGIKFFDDDPTYGNGLRGMVQAKMLAGLEVEATALFGRKGYSYWYVDARLNLPLPGIPIAPPLPLSVYGFGGGAFYNLKQKPLPTAQQLFDKQFSVTDLYEPAAGNVGFKATIIMGMSDGELFQAEGTLTTVLDVHHMGVRSVEINANTAQMASLMQTKDAAIKGIGIIRYDFAEDVFEALIGMNIDVLGVMKGSSALGLHVGGRTGQWYIKIGEPAHPNSFPMYGFASFNSYFMAGSADLLPEMPPPPPEVVRQTGYAGSRPYYANGQMRGLKLAFGANMQFTDKGPKDMTFLIFYAKIGAGVGFDLTLQQFETGCDGTSGNLPGINGWYANGQLWAWLYGAAGVNVDLDYLPKVRVKAFEVQAAALLKAGLPGPTWFEGWFGGGFSVLGGAVKGYMNFKVNFNEEGKCYPQASPFSPDDLISQVNPTGDSISIMANPQVAFNYPVETPLDFVITNSQGVDEPRRFKLVITQLDLINKDTGQTEFGFGENSRSQQQSEVIYAQDHYLATLFNKSVLQEKTNYEVVVHVKVQEWSKEKNDYINYIFPIGGPVVEKTGTAIFKSGGCPKDLKQPNVLLASYPFKGQRFLLQDEERNGKIMLGAEGLDCLISGDVYAIVAKFTSYGAAGPKEHVVPVTMTAKGSQLSFRIPTLPNDAVVQARFVQQRKPRPADVPTTSKFSTSYLSKNLYAQDVVATRQREYQDNKSTVVTRKNTIEGLALTEREYEEVEIYRYYFKTSKFNTLSDKLAAISDGGNAVRTTKFGNAEGYNAELAAAEGFDVFDVKGGTYRNKAGKEFALRPLIFLREDDRWQKSYVSEQLYRYYFTALFQGYPGINLGYKRNQFVAPGTEPTFYNQFSNYVGVPPVGPVVLSPWSAEPPLSQFEINAVVLPTQYTKAIDAPIRIGSNP
jgi:TANFOR domain-containing protein